MPLLLAALSATASAAYDDLSGGAEVVGVPSGDRVEVRLDGGRVLGVDVPGIDAPEPGQTFSRQAHRALDRLLDGEEVRVDADASGRPTLLRGETDVAAELVRRGLAWAAREAAPGDRLYALEQEARAAGEGLWADPHPMPPWIYRAGGRRARGAEDVAEALRGDAGAGPSRAFRGHFRTWIYYRTGCPGFDDVPPELRVPFGHRLEAEGAGYRPAPGC